MEEKLEKVKMKAGLEIHQQLDSHKLYCNCPSVLRKDEPGFIVNRRLHAVAGEGGEVDVAAQFEAGLDKDFIYQGYDTTCLVELDEEPPHLVNQEALQIALHISLLLNCEIVPVSQIMRKTVIDGSNTSGFQRTVLVGRNGWIDTSFGKVGIDYVYLEEDAARGVGQEDGKKIFRLDRLGIPLVEVVTAPDIKTPEQAKELALQIGDILRSCKVKRGLGTIRQDINVSIPGHPRAEIKGFQDPDIFVDVVNNEIKRQQQDLDEKKELKDEVRGANPDATTKFLRPLPGSARMYPETDLPLLKINKQIIDNAKKTLPKLRSEVRKELSKKGLSEEQIKLVLKENKLAEFGSLLRIIKDSKFVYQVLIEIPKEVIKHEGKGKEELSIDVIENIINAIYEGKIKKQDVKHVMTEIVKGKLFEEAIKIEKVDLTKLEAEIAKIIKNKPGLSIEGYMGLIMGRFKGKISGAEVRAILEKILGRKF
jgi:Glu-tRNA(Gln) amidotransferase subunit E-like FAD-binding protein